MQDPRHRNKFHETHSLSDFIAAYVEDYTLGLKAVDMDALGRAISAIQAAADAGKRIYAIGNGGSTAVADHLCCDFT